MEGMFGFGEVFHLDIRGVLKYGLEVIRVGHVDQWLCNEGC